MKYYATRSKTKVTIQEAVLRGLADDGSLFMPEKFPKLHENFFETITERTLPEIGFEVGSLFLGDSIGEQDLRLMLEEVLNFEIPVVPVEDSVYSLELFHGPTMAFKDVGARFMARLMSHYSAGQPLKIVTATSGDTGGAVAAGFYNVPGIEVYIMYPSGKVSPLQEKQITSWGKNIRAIEVSGTFDDCQALAKKLLADEDLKKQRLTSANSINIARLIPQSFYYFWAYAQLKKQGKEKIVFSVPSGNFGNLTAGLFAWKMGLPVERFVASTNINKVVPQYLMSGVYEPAASISTISNAMDVGAPSNFERMRELFGDRLAYFRNEISGYYFTDEQTREAIRQVNDYTGYILDPHGAVAYLGLKKYLQDTDAVGVLLETAHPAKFSETVDEILSHPVEMPEAMKQFLSREKQAVSFGVDFPAIREFILNH